MHLPSIPLFAQHCWNTLHCKYEASGSNLTNCSFHLPVPDCKETIGKNHKSLFKDKSLHASPGPAVHNRLLQILTATLQFRGCFPLQITTRQESPGWMVHVSNCSIAEQEFLQQTAQITKISCSVYLAEHASKHITARLLEFATPSWLQEHWNYLCSCQSSCCWWWCSGPCWGSPGCIWSCGNCPWHPLHFGRRQTKASLTWAGKKKTRNKQKLIVINEHHCHMSHTRLLSS